MIDHARLAEMTAAYSLGALDAAEADEVRAHLGHCDECAAEVRAFKAVVQALAQSAPPAALSADAKRRLLAAAAGDAAADALLRSKRPAGAPVPLPRTTSGRTISPSWWRGLAAAAIVVAGVVGVNDLHYRADMDRHVAAMRSLDAAKDKSMARLLVADTIDRQLVVALAGEEPVSHSWGDDAHGWWCRVVMPTGGHPAMVLTVAPAPPPGRAYEVWLVRHGKPHSAGMMTSGTGMVHLPMPPAKGDVIAFTMEPASGSAAPTGGYIMQHTM